jgi:hypothetical protein
VPQPDPPKKHNTRQKKQTQGINALVRKLVLESSSEGSDSTEESMSSDSDSPSESYFSDNATNGSEEETPVIKRVLMIRHTPYVEGEEQGGTTEQPVGTSKTSNTESDVFPMSAAQKAQSELNALVPVNQGAGTSTAPAKSYSSAVTVDPYDIDDMLSFKEFPDSLWDWTATLGWDDPFWDFTNDGASSLKRTVAAITEVLETPPPAEKEKAMAVMQNADGEVTVDRVEIDTDTVTQCSCRQPNCVPCAYKGLPEEKKTAAGRMLHCQGWPVIVRERVTLPVAKQVVVPAAYVTGYKITYPFLLFYPYGHFVARGMLAANVVLDAGRDINLVLMNATGEDLELEEGLLLGEVYPTA